MLFGHQNDDTNQSAQDASETPVTPPTPPAAPGVNPLAIDPDTGVSLPSAPAPSLDQPDDAEPSVLDQPAPASTPSTEPAAHFSSDPETIKPTDSVAAAHNEPAAAGNDTLLQLKQQVLTQLSPLVSHLDQSPEEKFRTTMMLIQSTDNQALLQDAYDAAQKISDDKARAQALLDVVNEINYFTQQSSNS